MLQAVMNLSQLAESDARRQEAQLRERHHAASIAAIVCRIWQDRTRIGPSVRQQPPRFSNITETEAWRDFRFRAEERKLCPEPLRALRIPRRVVLRSGSTFHVETALRLPPSLKECVALLVARTTCNVGVPAHKEFLRARQTPVPLICIVCWVLACTAPGTRYFCRLRVSLFSFFSLRRMGKNKA